MFSHYIAVYKIVCTICTQYCCVQILYTLCEYLFIHS